MGAPSEHIKHIERLFKNIWARVEQARLKYRPRYGYLSVPQAEAIMRSYADRVQLDEEGDREALLKLWAWRLLLLAAWRMTKGIYRFSPAIYDEVLETPLDEALPCAVFHNIPEWCVFVETPDYQHSGDPRASGFFFGVVEGPDKAPVALAWYGVHMPIFCPLDRISIQSVQEMFFKKHSGFEPGIQRMIALSLYLCAQNADISGHADMPRPCNPEPTKTRHGPRTFPRDRVRTWDVGSRVAAELRRASSGAQDAARPEKEDEGEAQRARPRPHTRRAHRHSYWIKNEDGERALISRWIDNINVNTRTADDIIETVRPVPETGAPSPANAKIRMH